MSFGRPYVMRTTGCIHDGWLVLSDYENAFDQDFLYHLLGSPLLFDQFDSLAAGSTVRNLNIELASRVLVPVPPKGVQQRIVAILDEAFDGIATARANAEKNLQNARELFESFRQAALSPKAGWKERALNELCEIKHGFAFKSEFFQSEGDYALLTPGNFYESGGYRDRGAKQKFYSGEIPEGYVLDEGNLLVAMTEQAAGLLGSPILVPEPDKFLHNQRLGLVNANDSASWSNEFFFHVFNSASVRKEIHDSATGVKVRHTSPTKIGEVRVSFPSSRNEQAAIVKQLLAMELETQRLESLYQQKLAALAELKKSLLHEAFSGRL